MKMNGAVLAFVAVTFVVASVVPSRAQSPCEVTQVVSTSMGVTGSAAGAVIGSAAGPLGTVVGSVFGGLFGSIFGGVVAGNISGASTDCITFYVDTGPVPLDGGSTPTWGQELLEYSSVAVGNPTSDQIAAVDRRLAAFSDFENVFKANQVLSSRTPTPAVFLPAVLPVPVNSGGVVPAAYIGRLPFRGERQHDPELHQLAGESIANAHPRIRDAFRQLARNKDVREAVAGTNSFGNFAGAIVQAQGIPVFVPAFLLLNNAASTNSVVKKTFDVAIARAVQSNMVRILMDDQHGTLPERPLTQPERRLVEQTIKFYQR